METVAVAADAALIPEGGRESLSEREAAIFHGVMGVHRQIALANEIQIHRRVFGKQGQHVVEKGDARFDPGFPFPIKIKPQGDSGFQRVS